MKPPTASNTGSGRVRYADIVTADEVVIADDVTCITDTMPRSPSRTEPQWQTVQGKRRVKSQTASNNRQLNVKRGTVIGKAKDLQIKAVKRVANVFVSR